MLLLAVLESIQYKVNYITHTKLTPKLKLIIIFHVISVISQVAAQVTLYT